MVALRSHSYINTSMAKLKFMRGARFLQQLNEESSYIDLERNTVNFTPASKNRRDSATETQVTKVELVPYAGSGQLGVNATVSGKTGQYQSQVLFLSVDFLPEDTPENVTFLGADGANHHIMPISLGRTNVKVRCTCPDFKWRFAIYNDKDGSLYGDGPGLYQKKTQRPPNNPQGVPGLCKHLLRLATELKNNEVIVP